MFYEAENQYSVKMTIQEQIQKYNYIRYVKALKLIAAAFQCVKI